MASSEVPESGVSDDYLDALIKQFQQNFESSAQNVEQAYNKKDYNEEKKKGGKKCHLEDSEKVTPLEDSKESEGAEGNVEAEDDEDNAEDGEDSAEDGEDKAEPDAEGLEDNDDADYEKNVHGDAGANQMEAPVCLIENTANGKLVVKPEAIDILSRIHQPVVVVAIVGMYRTGKSYLMNKLAGVNKGFNLGSTVQSETKGIWMWCVPHPRKLNHTLVLLDTEGLGDVEKGDSRNDTWLFSLALLLSSALVYNSKGTIDQDALDKLKFVGEVSSLIKVKTGRSKHEDEHDYSTHFPIFVWAVRDFLLQLIIGGKPVTADGYMENALRLKTAEKRKKLSPQDKEFNKVRQLLRLYFGSRKCFTFDLPTADRKLLHKLDQVSDDELSPDFVAQTKKFCDYVFKNAKVKRLDVTVPVTGQRLGELAKIYTDALCSSKIACLDVAVTSLSDQENQRAVQEALEHYGNKMKEVKLPTETNEDFFKASKQYEEEARAMFMEKSFRDEGQRFLTEFVKKLHSVKNEFYAMNEKKSQEICEALIKKCAANFEKALLEGTYLKPGGYGKYKEDLLVIEISYNEESGKGVKAEEVLQEYIKSKKLIELSVIQEDNALTQREKEMAEEKSRKEMEEKMEQIRRMEEELRAQKQQEARDACQQTIKELMEKMDEERKLFSQRMEEVLKEKERERDLYMKQAQEQQARQIQNHMNGIQKEIRFIPCTIS